VSQSWTGPIVATVNEHLRTLFEQQRAQVTELSPYAAELIDAAAELTMRGGKRLRCLILYAGFRAAGGPADTARILDLAAAIELLQTYLLIQDDWMDDDAERRGGPSVHAAIAQRRGDAKLGASLAILASDLTNGFAHEALQRGAVAAKRTAEILARFSQMHTEVVCGQQMDLLEHAEVERMHDLKTGSYTVRGPLQIGALLADASPEQMAALDRFGRPLGIAFQLRDDLLGTYGDPQLTGKPAGHDLREGKNTSLVREARVLLDEQAWSRLESVLGNSNATPAQLLEAARTLESCGARARVEAQLATLANEAESALTAAPLGAEGVAMLRELLNRLVLRDR
jgi:geranylgeranyl diphosphate synthase type I